MGQTVAKPEDTHERCWPADPAAQMGQATPGSNGQSSGRTCGDRKLASLEEPRPHIPLTWLHSCCCLTWNAPANASAPLIYSPAQTLPPLGSPSWNTLLLPPGSCHSAPGWVSFPPSNFILFLHFNSVIHEFSLRNSGRHQQISPLLQNLASSVPEVSTRLLSSDVFWMLTHTYMYKSIVLPCRVFNLL